VSERGVPGGEGPGREELSRTCAISINGRQRSRPPTSASWPRSARRCARSRPP